MVNFSHQAPLTYLKDRVILINRFVYNHPEESSQLVSNCIQIPIIKLNTCHFHFVS